ncbi:hypothetical protein [Phytopseudomonas daroniae]|uniref:hypothetical protein n=1 Tax=Phytopseudomonas daroniae TaxID=2487519 RepID=UPI0010383FA4|nr:hypothetical protein [Pseudomonas daroniae]TBU77004.1 hypothetical protein DNK10_05565 [Pseudomonas daroniae]
MKSPTVFARLLYFVVSVSTLLTGSPTNAADATISAYFAPNLQDASQNQFTNTTPSAFFCQRWPEVCNERQVFTVGIDSVRYNKRTIKQAANVRERFYIKTPATRRIRMTSTAGDSFTAEFQITSISQRVEASDTPRGDNNPVFTATIMGGCSYQTAWGISNWAQYFWRINNPASPSGCYSDSDTQTIGFVKDVRTSEFAITYRLITPTPHSIVNGVYTGETLYHIGNNADFDFGDNVTELSQSTISIAFELTVKHQVRVEFPPGSDRAVLEPQGGWGEWVHRGRQPTRLYRDLPFRLWSGGPFNMYLNCQYSAGSNCAIRNQNNSQVPINVAVTLPSHVALTNGGAVRRESLPVGSAAAKRFRSVSTGLNQPAQLHFEASQAAVNDMLKQPGSTYQGDVTIIFDAEM